MQPNKISIGQNINYHEPASHQVWESPQFKSALPNISSYFQFHKKATMFDDVSLTVFIAVFPTL